MTPFTKLEVSGPGALEYLQHMTCNQMARPVGRVTYTSMLNERGGIKCDLTITRLAEDRFLVITGGDTGPHDLAWMRKHLPLNGLVTITDVSSNYCCIGMWGPRARDLLQRISSDNVSNEAFPYMTAQQIMVGEVPALAVRISYVGELGWELYAKTEYGLRLWDVLWEAGQSLGIIAAGGGAFESLRLEKGYRLWGNDIHTEYNPYEAGLGFAVRLKKGDYIGLPALLRVREEGTKQRLCCMVMDNPEHIVMGKEPIFGGDQCIGYVTSANYGYTVGKSIAYGYLPLELADEGAKVQIEYFGKRYPATVAREPLFDPQMNRLKS
jgi:glycine cleavage system aminomethyltransferase T